MQSNMIELTPELFKYLDAYVKGCTQRGQPIYTDPTELVNDLVVLFLHQTVGIQASCLVEGTKAE
jgi:hypothetical protein